MLDYDPRLFSQGEKELLALASPQSLAGCTQAWELRRLTLLLRRRRDKFTDLHRRQDLAIINSSGSRSARLGANERTWVKAEVFGEAVRRVSDRLAEISTDNC